MATNTVFGNVILFLDRLGVYDVILPFLLVYTIIFAILEKTKVLGSDIIDGKPYPKKSLNAIVSFVTAFLVVASTQLVSVINQTVAQVALVAILLVSFMMLIGIFYNSEHEITLKDSPWIQFFMVILFIGIVLIFLNAVGWLRETIDFLARNYRTDWVASLILIALIVAFMYWIARDEKGHGGEHKGHEEKKGGAH